MRHRLVSRLFAGGAVSESVGTRVYIDAGAEEIWHRLLFYEEVPGRVPLLLRALLPRPVRTHGDKTRVGGHVRCAYGRGDLVKRITAVEPARLLQFEVVEQNLGIEGCVLVQGGSYSFSPCGNGTEVALVTNYRAYLRPRRPWRVLETLLVRRLHRHILDGVRTALLRAGSQGDVACTLPSCSPR